MCLHSALLAGLLLVEFLLVVDLFGSLLLRLLCMLPDSTLLGSNLLGVQLLVGPLLAVHLGHAVELGTTWLQRDDLHWGHAMRPFAWLATLSLCSAVQLATVECCMLPS